MLFDFRQQTNVTMWMKNTLVARQQRLSTNWAVVDIHDLPGAAVDRLIIALVRQHDAMIELNGGTRAAA